MTTDFTIEAKKKHIDKLASELKMLRAKAGVSQQELAEKLGVSRQTYGLIENKVHDMTWSHFLALTFLFKINNDTAKILEWTGAYTTELEQYLKGCDECSKNTDSTILEDELHEQHK